VILGRRICPWRTVNQSPTAACTKNDDGDDDDDDEMKLLKKQISAKDGSGMVLLRPDTPGTVMLLA